MVELHNQKVKVVADWQSIVRQSLQLSIHLQTLEPQHNLGSAHRHKVSDSYNLQPNRHKTKIPYNLHRWIHIPQLK